MTVPASTDVACQFRWICGRDVDVLSERHAAARNLVKREAIATYAQFAGAREDFPLFFYLERDGQVCASFRTIPDTVTFEGQSHPWAWTCDNYTRPDYRGRGLSTLLQRLATERLHQLGIGRGSVFSTDVTLHIFKKLGFQIVGHAPRRVLLRRVKPFVRAHIARPSLQRAIEALAAPPTSLALAGLRTWNAVLRPPNNTEVCECSVESAELHPLLDRIAANRNLHFAFHHELLAHKVKAASRTGNVSVWLARRRSSGEPVGYAVIRQRTQTEPLAEKYRDFRLMTLMDFAMAEDDVAAAIVSHLVKLFFESKCDVLEVISNNRHINGAAARRGMVQVGKGMSFAYSAPRPWQWPARLADLSAWPLTAFCGDGFSF